MRPRPPPSTKPSPRPQRTIKLPDKKPTSEPKTKQDSLKNDIALLMKSIDTNLSSIDQVLKVFRIATPEIIELLTKECSLIFECKICKNLFRSLANFMTHKRGYCLGKFEELFQNHEHCDHTWYAKCRKSKTVSSRSTTRKDILTILESMKHMTKEHTTSEDVILKDIPTTNEGLFNLRYESQEPKEKEKIVTVEPVDVDSSVNPEPIDSSKCSFCGKEFSSQKALNVHTKADHGDLRMCFVCPCCKKYFANTWSVYRHMYKVHRKTSEQVRKLRTQIQKKQVTLEELNRSKKSNMTSPVEERVDQDKAYMEELRGHASLQRCSGCGKKFERKVALLSHAAHCQKKKSIPAEIVHTLKRKSLTPMKVVEEKKLKMDDAEMIIRMKALDPRVVLKKTEFPIHFEQQVSVTSSNSDSSCKDDDALSTGEEEVNTLVQRYKGDCVYNENSFEDLLNKLHMEVPIDDTLENSDSDYSDNESKKTIANGSNASHCSSESDGYETEESDALLISSGDDESNGMADEHPVIKVEKNVDEESYTDNIDMEDNEVDELVENEAEEADENEVDSDEMETEDNGVNELEETDQHKKSYDEEPNEKCEVLNDNNNVIEEFRPESVNEDSSSVMNESLVTSEVGTSYLYEGQGEIEEGEAEVDGETEIEDEEEEAENVIEVEESETHEEETNEEEEEEETMDEEMDEEIEEKEVYDSQSESRAMEIESSNMNDIDSKDSSLDYISGLESSKEGENSKDFLGLENDKEALCDNLSNDSISNINIKDGLFSGNIKKKECTLVMDSGSLMMDDTIDNYDVAKEIVLFNDCEEVCISTLSDGEQIEDSLPSIQSASGKHSPLVNGDSSTLCTSSPPSAEPDEDADIISEKWDCVSKKINSYISCTKKKCLLCLKTFHRVNYVRRHVALHFNINKFKCLVNSCNFQSYLRSDMNNHLIRIHKKKELEPYVERLYPKKDFDECDYNPDPKPLYAFEKHYRTNNEDIMKKKDIELRILSDKEDNINSPLLIDGSDLDIIEETEVATVESIIPQQSVMQCTHPVTCGDNCS